MDINWYTGTILLGICFMVLELILGVITGFDLFLIGLILLLSGTIGSIFRSTSVLFIAASVLSLLYVFVFRMLIKSTLQIATKHTNTDALIGKKAIVVKRISPHSEGQVKIEGEVWRAESGEVHEVGTQVIIHSISGVTLSV